MGMNYDATRAERATPELLGETERSLTPLPDQEASASDAPGRAE
jgi:hypothetical protein